MSKYNIIIVPDPILKQEAQPVAKVDDSIRKQMEAMLETMYAAPGIGLAANQVSLLNRVLVIDLAKREERGYGEKEDAADQAGPLCMANPEVVWESENMSVMEEGCLSIPKQYADVERPATVKVKYLDDDGKEAELEAEGLLSHCVQHEIDHLNGVLFVDYLSSLKRNMILRRVEKLKKMEVL